MNTVINKQTKPLTAECIINRAAVLFKERGFRTTTLEQIADDFGVTRQAIYYYFESKNDILLSIIKSVLEKFNKAIVEALSENVPPHEKFLKVIKVHARITAENAAFIAVWHVELKQLPEKTAEKIHRSLLHYHKIMFDLYSQGVKEGRFRDIDPKIAVYTILGACQWSYSWYQTDKFPDPEDLAQEVVKLISKGFLLD